MATRKQQLKNARGKQLSSAANRARSVAMTGNSNAIGRGAWSDALRRAVARAAKAKGDQNYLVINRLADALVKAAGKGNVAALKEVGDRLDGKSVQEIRGPGDNGEFVTEVQVHVVGRKDD